MRILKQTKTQLEFIEALDRLLQEQNHQPIFARGGVLVVKAFEVRSENLLSLTEGVKQGGTYHCKLTFTQQNARTAAEQKELPEGYEADASAEEEIVDAELVEGGGRPELPSGEE